MIQYVEHSELKLRIESLKRHQLYDHLFWYNGKSHIKHCINHDQYMKENMLQMLFLGYNNNIFK